MHHRELQPILIGVGTAKFLLEEVLGIPPRLHG